MTDALVAQLLPLWLSSGITPELRNIQTSVSNMYNYNHFRHFQTKLNNWTGRCTHTHM